MSILLEFTVEAESFQLGRVLAPPAGMRIELERVVPTGEMVVPFLWAIGEEYEAFEASVGAHADVERFTCCERYGTRGLYRLEWAERSTDLLAIIAASGAVVLEAHCDDRWLFRLRFGSHGAMSSFTDAIGERQIPISVVRTASLTDAYRDGHDCDLTPDQHQAMVLALRRGYFATPSQVTLGELAAEFGISQQAMSKRIRRGNETLVRRALLGTGPNEE